MNPLPNNWFIIIAPHVVNLSLCVWEQVLTCVALCYMWSHSSRPFKLQKTFVWTCIIHAEAVCRKLLKWNKTLALQQIWVCSVGLLRMDSTKLDDNAWTYTKLTKFIITMRIGQKEIWVAVHPWHQSAPRQRIEERLTSCYSVYLCSSLLL